MTRSPSPDDLLSRLRLTCFGFPAVEEKRSHGSPSFFVRGKQFASFTQGYGRGPSAWVKCEAARQQATVAAEPARYFVPPYVGVKGWLGVILNEQTDWERFGELLEAAWAAVAPKSARDAPVLPPPRRSPKLGRTDPAEVAAALSKLESLALVLAPRAEIERHSAGATIRVSGRPLCYLNDNHHNDGILSVSVRCPLAEAERLAASDPRYYVPPYIGRRGWLAIRLDQGTVDWAEVEAYLARGLAELRPKRTTPKVP